MGVLMRFKSFEKNVLVSIAFILIQPTFAAMRALDFKLQPPSDCIIEDSYFFIGPLGAPYTASKHKTSSRVVTNNQSFGFRVKFVPVTKTLHNYYPGR